MLERRTSIRVPVAVETEVQVKEQTSPTQVAVSRDLSLGGIRLSASTPLEPGIEINVTFALPKEGKISLRGIVVWCGESKTGEEGYQAGVRWAEIHPIAQARLNAFLTDKTHTEPQFSFPASQLRRPIRWGRSILIGLLIGLISVSATYLWLDRIQLSNEIQSMRTEVRSYNRLVNNVVNRLFGSSRTSP